ncbi:MAG: aminotransferase class V-fold PLP-dependent enzyme, partial [Acidimicrobiales bacterium]
MATLSDGVPAPAPAAAPPPDATRALEPARVKADFPILARRMGGHRLVYLDSAASSQKPRSVIAAMDDYYEHSHANVHRGVYALAEEATARYEAARTRLGRLVGAPEPSREIVFT